MAYRIATTVLRNRFTLIELLVVVAIIGILASMLLPALSKARAKGMTTKCASNMKQVHLGFAMFETDHDGSFPPFSTGMNWDSKKDRFGAPYWSWHDWIAYGVMGEFADSADSKNFTGFAGFTKGVNLEQQNGHPMKSWGPSGLFQFSQNSIFDCPASQPAVADGGARWHDYQAIHKGLPAFDPLERTVNRKVGSTVYTFKGADKMHTRVSVPAEKILFMDGGGDDNPNRDQSRTSFGHDPYPAHVPHSITNAGDWWGGFAGYFVTRRHDEGCNITYIDGHVTYLRLPDFPNDTFWGNYDHDGGSYGWYTDTFVPR